jgi:hypothetical protein
MTVAVVPLLVTVRGGVNLASLLLMLGCDAAGALFVTAVILVDALPFTDWDVRLPRKPQPQLSDSASVVVPAFSVVLLSLWFAGADVPSFA